MSEDEESSTDDEQDKEETEMKVSSSSSSLTCDYCEKIYGGATALKAHMRIHNGLGDLWHIPKKSYGQYVIKISRVQYFLKNDALTFFFEICQRLFLSKCI